VLTNAADAMLNEAYQDQLMLVKGLIESGNLTRNQVAELLSAYPAIAIGNGKDAVLVMNGAFSLVSSQQGNLLSALSSTHLTIILGSLFVLAMGVYYIMTFIGGAMFTMNKALSTLANGDLTARMNFFQVRDEFSTIAITIDKVAEREQKMVLSIQESVA